MAGDGNAVKRSRSGKWLPGSASPNPGGRPKADPELRELIGKDGIWVWGRLRQIVEESLADGDRTNALRALAIMASKALPVIEGGAPEAIATLISPAQAEANREKLQRLIEAKISALAERRALVPGPALIDPALPKN